MFGRVEQAAIVGALYDAGGRELDAKRDRRVVDLDAVGVEAVPQLDGRGEDGDRDVPEPAPKPARRLRVQQRRLALDRVHHLDVVGARVVVARLPHLRDRPGEPREELADAADVVAVRMRRDDERDRPVGRLRLASGLRREQPCADEDWSSRGIFVGLALSTTIARRMRVPVCVAACSGRSRSCASPSPTLQRK